jgi:sarcosine oxidase subunit gamma
MSALNFERCLQKVRQGLKGPGAAEWLAEQGIALPGTPNTWAHSRKDGDSDALLVARLGESEFFLEADGGRAWFTRLSRSLDRRLPGVYPVLREDWAFDLAGEGVHEALAEISSFNFAALDVDSYPLIMTLMMGVSVLIVPQGIGERRYRIWCDPSFGPYFVEAMAGVVNECGGRCFDAL